MSCQHIFYATLFLFPTCLGPEEQTQMTSASRSSADRVSSRWSLFYLTLNPFSFLNVSVISHLLGRRLHFSFGPSSPQALVAVVAAPPLLQQRHTGASHRDGDVDLRV